MATPPDFAERGSPEEVERGLAFQPAFDADGLIPAIVTDAASGGVLMFAWMNREALVRTLETRVGHFWSRSRGRLWRKGEESGNVLNVAEVLTDCDQDVLQIKVTPEGQIRLLAGGYWGFADGKQTEAKFGDLHGGSMLVATMARSRRR